MSAIYSGGFYNSIQLPEPNADTRRRSRNDNSCNRWHLVPSREEQIRRGADSQYQTSARSAFFL